MNRLSAAAPAVLLILLAACATSRREPVAPIDPANPPVHPADRIWSNGKYCAFPDLARFRGWFYCAFREGTAHVHGEDGTIRILRSRDGDKWEPVALLGVEDFDLRDPKLSVTPDGRLMVSIGGSDYDDRVRTRLTPHVSFSDRDGEAFSPPAPISMDEAVRTDFDWLWRVTWHRGVGYGVVYHSGQPTGTTVDLVRTKDGIRYEAIAHLDVEGNPNEATVRVLSDGLMACLLRREGGDRSGYLGLAAAPYADWKWRDTGFRLGGPNFVELPNGRLIAGTRRHLDGATSTRLFEMDREGRLTELLMLPSGGDTSYPGMIVHRGRLWVVYYSSHEGAASISLARIPLKAL